ncbi:MAG: hypothetical protein ABWY19_01205 [Marmoricola sp.]
MSARLTGALALVVLLLSLAGCSGGDDAQPQRQSTSSAPVKTLTEGTCWSDQHLPESLGADGFGSWVEKYADGDEELGEAMKDDAAYAKEIDCSEPHALELYGVVEVSPALTERIGDYTDLLDRETELYRQVRDQVNDRCMAGSAWGKAQRKAGGLNAQLGPSLNVDSGLRLTWDPFPADLWEKGQHKFVCNFEQDEPGTLLFADLPTKRVPIEARVCLNTPSKYVPCSGKHQAEDIGEMMLNTAIARGQIAGDEAVRKSAKGEFVRLPEAQYDQLDTICQSLFRSVSTVKGDVEARAYPGAASQWPTENGVFLASCFVLQPVSEPPPFLPGGSVFNRS